MTRRRGVKLMGFSEANQNGDPERRLACAAPPANHTAHPQPRPAQPARWKSTTVSTVTGHRSTVTIAAGHSTAGSPGVGAQALPRGRQRPPECTGARAERTHERRFLSRFDARMQARIRREGC
jgi:hypothetical protein